MPTTPDELAALRQHVEDLFAAHLEVHEMDAKALILARETSERSLDRALESMDKRLEGMNEFRSSLSDITARAISREEYMAAHQALDEKYDSRVRGVERLVYMATGGVTLAVIVVNLLLYFISHK